MNKYKSLMDSVLSLFKTKSKKNTYETICVPMYNFSKRSRIFSVPKVNHIYPEHVSLFSLYNPDIGYININTDNKVKIKNVYVYIDKLVTDGDKLCDVEIMKE